MIKKTLSEKILTEANSGSKTKASILRFKANPAAALAKIQRDAEKLHAEMKARAPKKAKLSSKAEMTTLVVPAEYLAAKPAKKSFVKGS
jgi:hypothetical protein